MSDGLIERLETYHQKGHDAKSQNAAMIYEGKFRELCWASASEILSALKTVRGIEGQPHVIDEDHAYGDQEIYYGVLIETNFVEGEQSVVQLVACVSEESAYLSDNHGDLRDIDEFNFVVGPFKR